MTPDASLIQLGWHRDLDPWGLALPPAHTAGRVVRVDRGEVDVAFGRDEAGDLRATSTTSAKDCVAGDWVGVDRRTARVEAIAPRRTAFVRRAARGARAPQTLAANIDLVLVVSPLHPTLNLRRLERELVLAHDSGATPLVVLTKLDLADPDRAEPLIDSARRCAPGCEVLAVSNPERVGLDVLRDHLSAGTTAALLGASGAGKSSLVNALADRAVQLVGEVRDVDGKGRHTTTAARLLRIGRDWLLMDTPGVRALGLWECWDGLAAAFRDIEDLAADCQFADCFHDDEPGCAVRAAAGLGTLDPERLDNWRRMRDEMATLDADLEQAARRQQRTGRPGAR